MGTARCKVFSALQTDAFFPGLPYLRILVKNQFNPRHRGHQRSFFAKFIHCTRKCLLAPILSELQRKLIKVICTSWNALSTGLGQIWPKVNSLTSRGHRTGKWVFSPEFSFANYFCSFKDRRVILVLSSFLVKTNLLIYDLTSKGQLEDSTWGEGHEVT